MVTINDEFPEVAKAAQAARILAMMSKAASFTVFAKLPGSASRAWRVSCDGEWFDGETLADALAQCAQWLEAREVQ